MKCKSCGAEITGRICEYCGTKQRVGNDDSDSLMCTLVYCGKEIPCYVTDIKTETLYGISARDINGNLIPSSIRTVRTFTVVER